MNLGNPIETVLNHLLIGGMTCLGCQDEFPMLSAQMYVMYTTYDLWLIMKQDYQLS